MVEGEVLGLELAFLHKTNHQRVSHEECGGSGGGRCQSERAGLVIHMNREDKVAVFGEMRSGVAGHGYYLASDATNRGEHVEYLGGLAAVADEDHYILGSDDAQVTMHGLGGINKDGMRAGRGQGRGYFVGDDARFADSHQHQFAFASQNSLHDSVEIAVDGFAKTLELVYLLLKYLFCSVRILHHFMFFTTLSISIACSSSGRISLRYSWLAASEMAAGGLGCTSRKSPSLLVLFLSEAL